MWVSTLKLIISTYKGNEHNFREKKDKYDSETEELIKQFVLRYINNQMPVVCYAALEIFTNFVKNVMKYHKESVSDHKILNQICQFFLNNTNKYTVRALVCYKCFRYLVNMYYYREFIWILLILN